MALEFLVDTFFTLYAYQHEPHLRKSVFNPLLAEGKLVQQFSKQNSHPKQCLYSPKRKTVYDADVEIVKGDMFAVMDFRVNVLHRQRNWKVICSNGRK